MTDLPPDAPERSSGPWHPRDVLHAYWREPGPINAPETYVEGAQRSELLVKMVHACVPLDASILEIGCNVGRNLEHLRRAGYHRLAGIEINEQAVALMRQTFPELAATADIRLGAVEDRIRELETNSFDLVYTMAVLEHIHPDSEWIFSDLVRVSADFIITIEEETGIAGHVIPRNYEQVFTACGMRQVEWMWCRDIDQLGENYVARILRKPPDLR